MMARFEVEGVVVEGHGMASGRSVGQPGNWFGRGTLEIQDPYLRERGIALDERVPALHRGTINVEIDREIALADADFTVERLDWTAALAEKHRIAPETFSFVRCVLTHRGEDHAGLIYYPHPETKPPEVRHRYDVLEVLTHRIPGLAYGDPVRLGCRAGAFRDR
jgi:hypothetical protein